MCLVGTKKKGQISTSAPAWRMTEGLRVPQKRTTGVPMCCRPTLYTASYNTVRNAMQGFAKERENERTLNPNTCFFFSLWKRPVPAYAFLFSRSRRIDKPPGSKILFSFKDSMPPPALSTDYRHTHTQKNPDVTTVWPFSCTQRMNQDVCFRAKDTEPSFSSPCHSGRGNKE